MKTCVELIWTDLIESEIVLDEPDKKKEKIDVTSSVRNNGTTQRNSVATCALLDFCDAMAGGHARDK